MHAHVYKENCTRMSIASVISNTKSVQQPEKNKIMVYSNRKKIKLEQHTTSMNLTNITLREDTTEYIQFNLIYIKFRNRLCILMIYT